MLAKSLLFTIPVAGAILIWQSWFHGAEQKQVCLDRGTFVAGAFALTALLTFVEGGHAQVRAALGISPSVKYHGQFMLFLVALALVFTVVRSGIGSSWR